METVSKAMISAITGLGFLASFRMLERSSRKLTVHPECGHELLDIVGSQRRLCRGEMAVVLVVV